jgi:hypothetical protein
MGVLTDGAVVISFPIAKVKVTGFTSAAGARGVTKVRVDLEVSDPWELADLIRDLAEIREHMAATRAPRVSR